MDSNARKYWSHKKLVKTRSVSNYWESRRHILLIFIGFALGYILFDEELLVGVTCIICLWTIKFIVKKMSMEVNIINEYIISTLRKLEEAGVETQNLNYKIVGSLIGGLFEVKELQVIDINNGVNEYIGAGVDI